VLRPMPLCKGLFDRCNKQRILSAAVGCRADKTDTNGETRNDLRISWEPVRKRNG
jgi:hypothetical protein